MTWLLILLSITLLTIIYYVSHFTLIILFRVNNKHYFLGFGNSLFEFKIRDVVFTMGIFIPVFGLARFCKVEDYTRKRADYPWQFSHRPLLIRLLATYGGVLSLFFSTMIILIGLRFFVPDTFISKQEINKHGIYPSKLAQEYGFQKGDRVLTVNGKDYETFNELLDPDVYLESGNTFKVLRDGQEFIIHVPEGGHDVTFRGPFLELMYPIEIDSVLSGSPAEAINLQKGDHIVRVNGVEVDKAYQMREEFSKDVDGTVDLQIHRLNKTDTVVIAREVGLDHKQSLGIFTRVPINYTVRSNTFLEAIGKGVGVTFQLLEVQIKSWFGLINSGSVKGGPVSSSTVFDGSPNWELFWYLTANYATLIVAWNFFPYPRSCFWELIPLAYEGVTKKKYPYSLFRGSLSLAWFIFWTLILITFIMDMSKLF